MVNFGPLTAEIGSGVWAPSKFQPISRLGFVNLLQRRRSPETNQTLHDVWPSPELVHYITHFWNVFAPDGIISGAKFNLRPSLAFYYIGSITAQYSTSGRQAKLCGVVQGM